MNDPFRVARVGHAGPGAWPGLAERAFQARPLRGRSPDAVLDLKGRFFNLALRRKRHSYTRFMQGFSLHPNVYSTGQAPGLVRMLEQIWVRDQPLGTGSFYIISGFGNYNGGVRFFEVFRQHVQKGGKLVAFFAGSTAQKLTSRQVVEELLEVGAEVHVVNRKRQLYAKCYGTSTGAGDRLVVSSGNFTGPGMGQNVEATVILEAETTRSMGFSWKGVIHGLLRQSWDRYKPNLRQRNAPAWKLLYDEFARDVALDESEESTIVLTLGHADTVRIQATPGTDAGRGTQYFWLSKDCYGFFPPLTIRNQRGHKATFSCLITIHYIDLARTVRNTRVTFEAENNFDFRLGTGPLRYTKVAHKGDLVALSRIAEDEYELRLFHRDTAVYNQLRPFAINHIRHQGKQYGFLDNEEFARIIGVRLPATAQTAMFNVADGGD